MGGKQLRNVPKATNPVCKALHDRLVANEKNKKSSIIALCNKPLQQVLAEKYSGILYLDNYFQNIA